MSPLDTGSVAHVLRLVDPLERAGPVENDYPTIGEYLRAVREHNGLTLAEVSQATRVSKQYLKALEEGDGSALPARPFTIGYVRAYAKALDLDDEAAAARYKRETPQTETEALRNPIGVKHEKSPKSPWVLGGFLLVAAAVIGWNVVQRATAPKEPSLPAAALDAPAPAAPQNGLIALGAATPPPAEQTTPMPYVTPGLAPVDPALSTTSGAAAPAAAPSAPPAKFPTAFTSKSPVYGAPAGPGAAILQAGRPASLIIRGPSGAVHFARQLAAGEAYRAPLGQRLTAEVTDPGAFGFYVGGALRGSLVSPTTPIDQAAAESAPRPAPAAAAPRPVVPVAPPAVPPAASPASPPAQ
jgi:cytoskeletal protein RodZ